MNEHRNKKIRQWYTCFNGKYRQCKYCKCLGIFVNTGSRNEYPDESGVSHFIEHMMFKGTKLEVQKEISELIDNEGGLINAYTSRDMTAYYIQMLSSTKLIQV